jgi:glycosyltransferase involved in cell wall biosynthesis
MKVAVCIPTWNRANMLAIAIDSLLRQTEAKFDVHIFDDASPDFTQNLIEKRYAGKVFYHRSPTNLGYVGNVNRCLNLAKNYDWIGILQDDDCHLAESVATIIKYAKKYAKAGIIFSKYNSIDAQGKIIQVSEGEEQCWQAGLEAMRRCQGQIPCSATFYRAEAILGCGLYDSEFPYSADEEYATRIGRNYDVVETKEILACYRRHPGHQMIRTWCKPDFIESFEKMRIRMAGYAGTKETEAIPIVRRDLAEIFKASAAWLAAEGHWYPAMRFHAYALKYNLKLYLGVKSIIHAILQSAPFIGKAYYRSRLGWSTQV